MKKAGLLMLGGGVFVFLLIFVFLLLLGGGDAGGAAAPIPIVATEDEAYAYQYVGTELGVPWDIVLLTDAIHAWENGEGGLENYNPLGTSLEFCILVEEKKIAEKTEISEETEETEETTETETAENDTETDQDTEEDEDEEPEYNLNWVDGDIVNYVGREEILRYLGLSMAHLTWQDANSIIVKSQQRAEEKNVPEEVEYTVTLISNPDYEEVLRERIGLDAQSIVQVMQLYDAGYLAELYGYTYTLGDIELPEIVVGNVTRSDLARVAVSLLGHPYLMGGKSSEMGAPKGALDCSGYVDWVYLQCFGATVSTGTLPEGVVMSGTGLQWYASEEIRESELKVGDLGFLKNPASMKSGQINHVGIYLGEYNGKKLWIHCGGRTFGTSDMPKGRVGISKDTGLNSYNPVTGTEFAPAMPGCKFKYYRRPRFAFMEKME